MTSPDLRDTGHSSLLEVLAASIGRDHREHIVFIDQVEEIFTKLDTPVLRKFFNSVGGCVSSPGILARFVFVIRTDCLPRLAQCGRSTSGLSSAVCSLGELPREGDRRAIIEPARQCKLSIEDSLAEAILDDLSPDTILPAHLQIVCDRVYQECRPEGAMTLAAYAKYTHQESDFGGYFKFLWDGSRNV